MWSTSTGLKKKAGTRVDISLELRIQNIDVDAAGFVSRLHYTKKNPFS
jgi:hypothetical protein